MRRQKRSRPITVYLLHIIQYDVFKQSQFQIAIEYNLQNCEANRIRIGKLRLDRE